MSQSDDFYTAINFAKDFLTEKYYTEVEAANVKFQYAETQEDKQSIIRPMFPTLEMVLEAGSKIRQRCVKS